MNGRTMRSCKSLTIVQGGYREPVAERSRGDGISLAALGERLTHLTTRRRIS
jgi:hypothetical protein